MIDCATVKVGDTVRIVSASPPAGFRRGEVVRVVDVYRLRGGLASIVVINRRGQMCEFVGGVQLEAVQRGTVEEQAQA